MSTEMFKFPNSARLGAGVSTGMNAGMAIWGLQRITRFSFLIQATSG